MKKITVRDLEIGDEWFGGEVFCFSKEFYHRFHKQMKRESDRSRVLIVAAVTDTILKERLIKKLTQGNADSRKRLFDVGGPFHSFSSKIEWLYCTGDISKQIRDDLHVLRDLRNQCAHDWEEFLLDKSIEDRFLAKMNSHAWIKGAREFVLKTENKQTTHIVEIEPWLQFTFMSSIIISTLNAVHTKSANLSSNVAP